MDIPEELRHQKRGDFIDGVYSGAAILGRVYSTIGAIISVTIALIIIIVGISILREPYTMKVTSEVTRVSNYMTETQNGNITYTCTISATYTVSGQKYAISGVSVSRSTPITEGSMITLYYNPLNPCSAIYEPFPQKIGWGLIGFGLLLGGLSVGIAVITYKSKGVAAAYGVVKGIRMIRHFL